MTSYELFKSIYSSDYITKRLSLIKFPPLKSLLQKILTVNQQERTDLPLNIIYQELDSIWKENKGDESDEGDQELAIYNGLLGIAWENNGGEKKALLSEYRNFKGNTH